MITRHRPAEDAITSQSAGRLLLHSSTKQFASVHAQADAGQRSQPCSFTTVRLPDTCQPGKVARRKQAHTIHSFELQPLRNAVRARVPALQAALQAALREAQDDPDENEHDDGDGDDVVIWGPDLDDAPALPPVSDEEEDEQLALLRSGQVPTLFLGNAFTNDAVNGMGVHKMQGLVEDMFYNLTHNDTSHDTVDLLLSAIPSLLAAAVPCRQPWYMHRNHNLSVACRQWML